MTGRKTAEWIGASPDAAIPDRVLVRVFDRSGGTCEACGRKVWLRKDYQIDHRVALVNGGENRESNLQVLCTGCHGAKTRADVKEKAEVYRKRKKHLGIYRPKRPFPGSRQSRWKRRMDGTVEER